jgi:hypothetical protein
MARWVYTEKMGKELRQVIDTGNLKHVLRTVYDVATNLAKTNYIHPDDGMERKLDVRGEFQDLAYLVEGEWDYTSSDLEDYGGWKDMRELADDRLAQLYDLCDSYSVWLAI